MNRERGSKTEVIVLDEGDKEEDQMFQFWKELGGKSEIGTSTDGNHSHFILRGSFISIASQE
jgi:hypothetical protein